MKNVILSVVMSIIPIVGFSQSETKDIDSKLKFGFNIGVNHSNVQTQESIPNNSEIYNGYGFNVGLILDYKLNNNLLFSPKTELSFNKSGIESTYNDNSTTEYKVFPASLDIMTHMVYRIGNGKTKPYILTGPKFSIPIFFNSKSSLDFKNKSDFSIDFGIGLENKLKYFFFAPEVRYSLGLRNINENPMFQTLNYHKLSFLFNFK